MDVTGALLDPGGLDGCDLLLAERLADSIEPEAKGRIPEASIILSGKGDRITAVSVFSGFVSSA